VPASTSRAGRPCYRGLMRLGPESTAAERWLARALGDDLPRHPGSGWISGVVGAFLGAIALGAVVVLHFPDLLTSADLRALPAAGDARAGPVGDRRRIPVVVPEPVAEAAKDARTRRPGVDVGGRDPGRRRRRDPRRLRPAGPLRARLVPAEPARVRPRVRAARAGVSAEARSTRATRRLDDRRRLLLRESRRHPAADVPVAVAGDGARTGAGHEGGIAARVVTAHLAAGAGTHAARRPGAILGAPRVAPAAVAVALSRDPPLDPRDGLARRFAAAPGRRRRHACAGRAAGVHARLRGACALCLARDHRPARRPEPREHALPPRLARTPAGDAAIPSLAPRGDAVGPQLRSAFSMARPVIRHALPAGRPLAGGTWHPGHPVPPGFTAQLVHPLRRR